MRVLAAVVVLFCAGCASYVTPGGPVHLGDIDRAGIADAASRQPSPHFPASLALARVQAAQYKSYSSGSYGAGRFSVVTTQELLTPERLQDLSKWPSVAAAAPLNSVFLPANLESLEDLRLAAAKLQADVLLVYTVDTSFQLKGKGYAPLTAVSLGSTPDQDACITSTASAVFTDVRTGFTYGTAEATAKVSGLTGAWGSSDTVDKKRLEAEHQAFALLMTQAEKTWGDITERYQ